MTSSSSNLTLEDGMKIKLEVHEDGDCEDPVAHDNHNGDTSLDSQNSSGEDSSSDRKYRRKSSKPRKVTVTDAVVANSSAGTSQTSAGICDTCTSPLVRINNNRNDNATEANAIILCVECTCEKISILLEENDNCESVRSVGSELGFVCKRCQPHKSFANSNDYLEHYVCEHELQQDSDGNLLTDSGHRCSHCGLQFRSEDDVEQHEQYHVDSEPGVMRCYFCCRVFNDMETLNSHQNSHATQQPHKCPVCQRSFSFTTSLRRHMLVHQAFTNSFSCQNCEEKFQDINQLEQHADNCALPGSSQLSDPAAAVNSSPADTSDDGGDRKPDRFLPYSHTCPTCGKSFRLAWRYQLHLKASCDTADKFNADSDRTCNICKKMFANPMNLHRHELIHAGIRNFSCQQCGKAFVQKTQLDTHMNIHRGIKPFQCEVCKKNFTDRSTFHKHKKIHGKPKAYPCNVCGKVFNQAGYLKLHTKVHSGNSSSEANIKSEFDVVQSASIGYCTM